jgi:hypothetical protein
MVVPLPITAAILATAVVDCCQVWVDVCVAVAVAVVATLGVVTADAVLLLSPLVADATAVPLLKTAAILAVAATGSYPVCVVASALAVVATAAVAGMTADAMPLR